MFKKVLAVTLALLMVFSLGLWGRAYAQGKFPDVPEDYWAAKQIYKLVDMGVLKGYPDGTFKPERSVTREEFATMIVLAKKLTLVSPSTPTFKDVSKTRWSYKFVETAVKAGYVKGYPDGTFRPKNPIKREELAAILTNVLGYADEAKKIKEPLTFSNDEDEIDKWAIGAMTIAVRPKVQVLKWDEKRNLRPRAPANRAECAYGVYMVIFPPKVGGSVAIATCEEPKTAFFALDSSAVMNEVFNPIYTAEASTLPTGVLYPVIAKKIPQISDGDWIVNPDGTMKTIWHLRKGAKWSDGKPITAEDFVFGYQLQMSNKIQVVSRDIAEKVAKIETPDPYTIIVYWNEKTIWAQYSVAGAGLYPAHILKPIFDKDPALINSCDYNQKPIHGGPYVLDEWSPGNYVILKKNPNYWGPEPLLDKIIFYFTPDTNTMLMQLLSGKVQMTIPGIGLDVPQAYAAEKRGLKKTHNFYYIDSVYWEHVTLNLEDPILKDKTLRKALMYALDRKKMSDKIFFGLRPLAYGFIPPKFAAFNKKLVGKYPYDPEKAKQILKDAGYTWDAQGNLINPDGKKVVIDIEGPAGYAVREQEIEFMAKYWKDNLGVTVNYVPKNWGPMIDDWIHGTFQGALFAWGADPADIIPLTLYHSEQIPTEENGWAGQNFTRYRNPTVDKLLDEGEATLDPEKRIEISKKIQEIIYDDLPELYLNMHVAVCVIKKGLVGFDFPVSAVTPSTWNVDYWYWEG